MSFFSDIQNLDRNNVGGWPQSIKIFFTVLLFGFVLLVGWYFFVSDQQDSLTTLANKENQLKQEFSAKQAKSVNLEALQQQLDEMQDMLRQLLRQLPSKTEMPELLIDISQTAQSAGLETRAVPARPGNSEGLLRGKADHPALHRYLPPVRYVHQRRGFAAAGGDPDLA